jgi:hypothetical protein
MLCMRNLRGLGVRWLLLATAGPLVCCGTREKMSGEATGLGGEPNLAGATASDGGAASGGTTTVSGGRSGDAGDAAAGEAGSGTELSACVGQTCSGHESCVAYRTLGHFLQPEDGGPCALGQHRENAECVSDFAYTCAALLSCDGRDWESCRCPESSACRQTTDCRPPGGSVWLDPAAQVVCEALLP